jgi:hypothetical protein
LLTDQPAGRFEIESIFAFSYFWVGAPAPATADAMVGDTARAMASVSMSMIGLNMRESLAQIRVATPDVVAGGSFQRCRGVVPVQSDRLYLYLS